jgi:3-dehydroquinate synthase
MSESIKRVSLNDYEIVLDDSLQVVPSFIENMGYSSVIILEDELTHIHCYPILAALSDKLKNAPVITVPQGEQHKTLQTCEEIWSKMLQAKADRKVVLINLGGGVIGDMGGFAAACYKRGVDFIQIPTTVLSQVDSSIGGKLGVDFKYGKNLIGVFKNPALVAISNTWLETLPERQIKNGFAEIFKHALISSRDEWEGLKNLNDLKNSDISSIIYQSLQVKKRVVEADPFEKGLRKILNFGHTIGHALEAWSLENDEQPLLHGEAIAAGMIMEAYIGHMVAGLSQADLDDISACLLKFYPYYKLPDNAGSLFWPAMALDKKNAGDKVLSVVLKEIGTPVIDVEITPELLNIAIEYYRSLQ